MPTSFPRCPRRAVLWLIFLTLPVRLLLAAVTGLGYGESYYTLNALNPQLSYFDQPPLAFWLASASGYLCGAPTALTLRLPSIICFAVVTYLMFLLGKKLFSARAGFYAALLLNLSMVFTGTTAMWLQPDAALMLFWLATALCLTRIFFREFPDDEAAARWRRSAASYGWWVLTGVFLGLTTLSKYHALFLFAGAGLFALTTPKRRRWLFHPGPYLALLIGLLVASPIFIWNAENNWVSFLFQSSRAGVSGEFSLHWAWLAQSLGGQALWLLPWIWLPLMWQLYKCFAAGRGAPPDAARWFLACTAILPIAFFTVVTLWSKLGFHFHWQAPGYLMLFPALGAATAAMLDSAAEKIRAWTKRWLWLSGICCVFFMVILQLHAATGFWTWFGPKYWAAKFGEDDPTLEGFDYDALREFFSKNNYLDDERIFLAVTRWYDAGKAGWALRGKKPVLVLNDDPRNPAFLYPQKELLGQDAILMSRYASEEEIRRVTDGVFAEVRRLPDLEIVRGGVVELRLPLYYCREMTGEYQYPEHYRRALAKAGE